MTTPRPLSPHLQIYKPQLTSVMSILHRATGIFLSLGTLVLVYWLMAAADGPEAYQQAISLLASWFGLLLLFGWSISLFYHLCNGIRHLFWDAGLGLDINTVYTTGKFVWLATFILTALAWLLAFTIKGAG
ncbi:MAG: succinate dehydrogenase, cytochrome b556 subunit [Candidatus Parabeggiatoa sp. nov. 3]|nr:MAG: succinate dehydrogenase, cytochrome b556 subunit [Gammaproteobacteria bacterium]RKZ61683.1 MAG: succinate dehydrogenase, cytochrome b556 subunit [Gammaproteobacteria bacterium]RKZ82997.1 MAG: succinate dehydrogenase, cytochrome b556 subunit [Gammaproteobacteria bacterium]HEW98689.1 succinate dehydrogenase, cytochrome b556 subunit [Beggiatoa sp.]